MKTLFVRLVVGCLFLLIGSIVLIHDWRADYAILALLSILLGSCLLFIVSSEARSIVKADSEEKKAKELRKSIHVVRECWTSGDDYRN